MKQMVLGAGLLLLSAFTGAEQPLPGATLLRMADQQSVNTQDLKGRVLYVDFWASWCKPCRKSFPFMNALHAKYDPERFAVIAVNMDENPEDAHAFLQDYPADFAIYADPQGTLAEALGVPGLPTAYIVDAQGTVRATHMGFKASSKGKVNAQLDYLVQQP